MNREQAILTGIMEEAAEVIQRASKAIRFGLEEVQEGQFQNNYTRLLAEFNELLALVELLKEEKPVFKYPFDEIKRIARRKQFEKWFRYSQAMNQVEEEGLENSVRGLLSVNFCNYEGRKPEIEAPIVWESVEDMKELTISQALMKAFKAMQDFEKR